MNVGSFGRQLVFEVQQEKILTPQTTERSLEAEYEEHSVLGAKPRLEFLAPKLDVFSLSVLLSASLGVNPRDTMVTVRALIHDGVVANLVLGGRNYGKYVLTKAKETWTRSGPKGEPMSDKVQLEFKEYVE